LEFLAEYGMFLAKAVTLVFFILLVVGNLVAMGKKHGDPDEKGTLKVTKINERFTQSREEMNDIMLTGKARKKAKKAEKARIKEQEKAVQEGQAAGRIFYLNFKGDLHAKATNSLREEISAVLGVATEKDEVIVNVESPGGVVHGYGFAASQLDRVRKAGVPLTVLVDKVAASGGYMMACVANKICAAPFSIIGSIGVVAQLPNFHRLLDKHEVDVELHTAGEYKRTLTMFGENTDEGRRKFKEDLEEAHKLFKEFIAEHRPELDIEKIATGEIWFGKRAKELGLVDEVLTSDEYLFTKIQDQEVFEVKFEPKKSLQERLSQGAESTMESLFGNLLAKLRANKYFS
jgi:serine protease SohB